MKSLFLPIVFAFCFVIMHLGTKAVPTGETPSIDRPIKQGLPWLSAFVRNPSAKANIRKLLAFFFVLWAGNKYAIFHPVPIEFSFVFQIKGKDM